MIGWFKKGAAARDHRLQVTRKIDQADVIARGDEAQRAGDFEQAAHCYEQALLLSPGDAALRVVMAAVLIRQKLHTQAKMHLNRAILLDPVNANAFYLLGKCAQNESNFSAAIENFSEALEINPDFEAVFGDLAASYLHAGQAERAKQSLLAGLARYPRSAQFHFHLGTIDADQQSYWRALEHYEKALKADPTFAEAHWFRGQALQQLGEISKAISSIREALSIKPDLFAANSTLIWLLSFYDNGRADQYTLDVRQFGAKVLASAQPFATVTRVTRGRAGGTAPHRLRVGLVSGDFKIHPVGYFLEGVLKALDPARLELIAYSMNPQDDELTGRIKGSFAQWIPIATLSDEDAARKIHADGIDILIDVSGHSAYNRLPVFAWKPAPVQISWLGYLASTGVPGMDYVLADGVAAPVLVAPQFTEEIWHLPETFNCFTPPAEHPKLAVAPPPALQSGSVTFGSFQRMNKLGDAALTLWAKILKALPEARLCLRNSGMGDAKLRARLLERLACAGVASDRITLEGAIRNREDFLAAYAQIDIILDTPQYPGTTTTCEALWMGVPTLTLAGNTLLRRAGASLLTCAGLTNWIASTDDEYVALAVKHASDVEQLARLRAGLRQQVAATALFDPDRFAPQFEEALFAMWQRKSACLAG